MRRGRPWPEPRFEPEAGLVHDRLTGLVWPQRVNYGGFPLTWAEAFDLVRDLNARREHGHNDWRLPNRRELRSVVSHQTREPVLPEGHPFREVFSGWYWTATDAARNPGHAWYVHLGGGRMFYGGKDQSFLVWPVRGDAGAILAATGQTACHGPDGQRRPCADSGQDGELRQGKAWPRPRFEDTADGVWDRLTGLVWSREADYTGTATTWPEALEAIGRLNRQGPGGWRLPNINELESLVDADRYDPALPGDAPFSACRDAYWSSTTSLYEPDWAWVLYLDKGAVGVGQKAGRHFRVWPVRDGP